MTPVLSLPGEIGFVWLAASGSRGCYLCSTEGVSVASSRLAGFAQPEGPKSAHRWSAVVEVGGWCEKIQSNPVKIFQKTKNEVVIDWGKSREIVTARPDIPGVSVASFLSKTLDGRVFWDATDPITPFRPLPRSPGNGGEIRADKGRLSVSARGFVTNYKLSACPYPTTLFVGEGEVPVLWDFCQGGRFRLFPSGIHSPWCFWRDGNGLLLLEEKR